MRLVVAGRTDAGVHARGQVAHADVDVAGVGGAARPVGPDRRSRRPSPGCAGILPRDVVVRRAAVAPPGFDARFSATSRRYLYRIADDLDAHDPLRRRTPSGSTAPLDVHAMHAAGATLLGLKDFAAFCKRRAGATTVRTLARLLVGPDADGVVEGTVVADAFCHSMVRSLVGAVASRGRGQARRRLARCGC